MRILWLSPNLRPIARTNLEGLRRLGHEILLMTSDAHPESDTARDYERVLPARPIPWRGWWACGKAYREARDFAPDVVVSEYLRDPRWRLFARLGIRARAIHDDKPHDSTHIPPWWNRMLFDTWDEKADATIVFSKYVARSLAEQGRDTAPIYVVPLQSDLSQSCVPPFVPSERRRDFLLIGRQRPYKNHSVVFAAWEAHTQGAQWRGDKLLIFGDGEITTPLPDYCEWIRRGYKYIDLVDRLASAKGSIVHYRGATQSGVQVLSMQLGVPTLVSDSGALPDYQPPGLSVTDIDDVRGLARAIDTLASPTEVAAQSAIALHHYTTHFGSDICADRMAMALERIAGGQLDT